MKISWNRKEILDIYDTSKHQDEQYPVKARLLKDKFYKFAHLDVKDVN